MEGDFRPAWSARWRRLAPCVGACSHASRKLDMPRPAMAASAVAGGNGLVLAAALRWKACCTQRLAPGWPGPPAGVWQRWLRSMPICRLLQNTSAALAGSYSFVNPAVALLVRGRMGGEHLTGWVRGTASSQSGVDLHHVRPRTVGLAATLGCDTGCRALPTLSGHCSPVDGWFAPEPVLC